MAGWGPSDDEKVKAHNDLMNWMKGCKKFSKEEINKIENLVEEVEQASYSLGHDWATLEAEAGEGL